MSIIVREKVPSKKRAKTYTTNIKKWLGKTLTFNKTDGIEFSDKMVMATVEFDKDHCLYVLMEEESFTKQKGTA